MLLVVTRPLDVLVSKKSLLRTDAMRPDMERPLSRMQATSPADLMAIQCCRKPKARSSRRHCGPCTCSKRVTHTRQPTDLPAMLLALSEGDCPHKYASSERLVARIKWVIFDLVNGYMLTVYAE